MCLWRLIEALAVRHAHDDLTTASVARSPERSTMFGYRTEERLSLKIRERGEAQRAWPFLSEHDLRAVRSPAELSILVAAGKRVPLPAARSLVASWLNRQRLGLAEHPANSVDLVRSTGYPPRRPDW